VDTGRAEQSGADTLIDRVNQWLASYEREVSTLVADEQLTQQFTPSTRGLMAWTRTLASTYSFIRLPGNRAWLGLREVQRVNGGRITDHGPSLRDVLAAPSSDLQALATELAWRNARHNMGAPRTLNVPTLPLELMDRRHRHRFTFAVRGSERIRGVQTTCLSFVEQVSPSLVKSPDGTQDLPTRGYICALPATGAIVRAEVEAYLQPGRAREWKLSVEFEVNRELTLLVPTSAREEFVMSNGKGSGRANYRNFRRFTTSARIVPN
jgi:hypothetical protein